MQTRRTKGKAPNTDSIFEDPEVCTAVRHFKDNWAEKYRDNRQLQNEHLEKYRLKVPLKKKEVEADFVAMKIWKFDGRGKVVEIEGTAKGETVAMKKDSKRSSPKELKRDSPQSKPSSKRGQSQKHSETTGEWEINRTNGTKLTLKRRRSEQCKLDELSTAPALTVALLSQEIEEIDQDIVRQKVSFLTSPVELWLMVQDLCINTTDGCKYLRRRRDSSRTFRD
jgi:hypothetical protein